MDRLRSPGRALSGFVIRFALYLGAAAAAIPLVPPDWIVPLQEATARLVAAVLGAFADGVVRSVDTVSFAGFAVRIVSECFGLLEMAIYGSAVLAFATSWRNRCLGLALGLPVIFAFNLMRILMLLLVGRYVPGFFEFAHVYFWQATLILGIIALWLSWLRFVVRDEPRAVVRA